ncbi:2OG-Fe(II) oxygenase [Prochlorococcus marinus XMU1403]|uniref:2OG-Fe(II) oxygenase n=1 Tax=Prochlorococcus marinus TaxID=1219 RepID=UPI000D9FC868|nr:2OG-Fe(II) oxygenase [Prochlorococcus marinus]MBW3048497.1 2OG-Fe(II) oxygenase [Prochlorococcus marinus str. MU1403]PYE03939.1 2OG-Fe(II) oxygenase [Prochlorococcus marinus XMU1403]
MKRSDLNKTNLNPNFIGSWKIESLLCDEIISHYERNQQKQKQGQTAGGIELESKNRLDITLSPKELMLPENKIYKKYFESLFECYKDYNVQWPFLGEIVDHLDIGNFNIGKYSPGQHFQKTHCERIGLSTLHRLLAFMTYLNDVEEGGSTYFNHYDLDIKPKKGLTLLWPAEWTHSHKGNVLKRGLKYIITGWLTFPK